MGGKNSLRRMLVLTDVKFKATEIVKYAHVAL